MDDKALNDLRTKALQDFKKIKDKAKQGDMFLTPDQKASLDSMINHLDAQVQRYTDRKNSPPPKK